MARPRREPFRQADQTYFVTFVTAERRCFFRNEPWAMAFLNSVSRYQAEYDLHDFIIMPDHVHLLLSPHVPLERVAQLLKGGFSFNAKRAFEWKGDIWQAGFSDHRIRDHADYETHVAYIRRNAATLGEGKRRFDGASCSLELAPEPQGLKPPLS
jgi:putative transposase